jgi:hypothetical protein
MDPLLEQWQKDYKNATPKLDTAALLSQITLARKKQAIKAWFDLVAGVFVSLFCIYALIFEATSTPEQVLYAILTPLPIGFSIWAFLKRKKLIKSNILDFNALLLFKKQQLINQINYWRLNLIGCSILWAALCITAAVSVLMYNHSTIWLIQLGIGTLVLILTLTRYLYLKYHLKGKLNYIDNLE